MGHRRPWFNPITSLRISPLQAEGGIRRVVWVPARAEAPLGGQGLSAGSCPSCRAGRRLPRPLVAAAVNGHPATSGEIKSAGTPVAISAVPIGGPMIPVTPQTQAESAF